MSDINMFENFYIFMSSVALPLNLIFYIVIFLSSFIIVFKNTRLPQWHVTPLWWVGLSSLACVIAIMMQYVFGPIFILSYKNIGFILELLLTGSLAFLAATFLIAFFLSMRRKTVPSKSAKKNAKRSIKKRSKGNLQKK